MFAEIDWGIVVPLISGGIVTIITAATAAIIAVRKATTKNTDEHNKTAANIDNSKDEILQKLDLIAAQVTSQATEIKNLGEGQEVLFNLIASVDGKLPKLGNSKGTTVVPPVVSRGNK